MNDVLLFLIAGLLVLRIIQGEIHMATIAEALQRLTNSTTRIETAADNLIEAAREIAGLLRDNANAPDQIMALADRLDAQANETEAAKAEVDPTP